MYKTERNQIHKFIDLQHRLKFAFLEIYPDVKDFKWLLDFPKSGILMLDTEQWRFNMHGTGLRFLRESHEPHIVVDMHQHFIEDKLVDEWRLLQFFSSISVQISEENLKSILKKLCLNGELVERSAGQFFVAADFHS
jgi:hypothetical protein